jgi:TonB family protein
MQAAGWTLDWGERRCSLIHQGSDARPTTFVVRSEESSIDHYEMVVRGPATITPGKVRTVPVTLRAEPNGVSVQADGVLTQDQNGSPILTARRLPRSLVEELGRVESLLIEFEAKPPIRVAFGGAAAAGVKGLLECYDDLLKSWGVDVALQRSLRRPAQGDLTRVISHTDYPMEALRKGEGGRVFMRLRISPEGRVSDCAVLISSGSKSLDQASCGLMVRKANLEPAIGRDGEASASDMVTAVSWYTG